MVEKLADSAADAETQALQARKAASESEFVAQMLATEQRQDAGPWLTELTDRLDRVEESVQNSAQATNQAFGQFHNKLLDLVDAEKAASPGTASDWNSCMGSPTPIGFSFMSPSPGADPQLE